MHCYRCDAALEPWLSEQWFVAVDKLKGPATDAVTSGRVSFHPDRWTQTYLTWMENLKDWCISRQLWWGHRIPVFYCEDCGWEDALMADADVCPKCGGRHVHQDENVLDTWFSSQLWTFATQGWPEHPEQLEGHHPTTALVTARDIIALWVARMVMSSLYFTDQIPFHDVVIYPTILAKDGSRMSKSKGNGVDPMDLIAMYGADAMRFGLLGLVTSNQDVQASTPTSTRTPSELLGSPRTENAKAFVTKIYNASRFVLTNLEGFVPGEPKVQSGADAWIFSRLAKPRRRRRRSCSTPMRSATTSRALYAFFWNEFCDWYIECCKAPLRAEGEERLQVQRNLVFVLDQALRLLHPGDALRHGVHLGPAAPHRGRRVGAAHHGVLARRGRARRLGRRGGGALLRAPACRRGRRPLDPRPLRRVAAARSSTSRCARSPTTPRGSRRSAGPCATWGACPRSPSAWETRR